MTGNLGSFVGVPLDKIKTASQRLEGVVVQSPFLKNLNLSEQYGAEIFFKREDLQTVRSFKIRGAYNKIASIPVKERSKGVVCASAGNHAQGVAYACSTLGINGRIYMPSTTPSQKIQKVRQFGKDWIEIILRGDTFDDAQTFAIEDQKRTSSVFVHPFDDEEVIAGQGTIGLEIISVSKEPLDFLFVAIGGGGLVSGILSSFKAIHPATKIIGVEAGGAPAMLASIKKGDRVILKDIDGFADGVAVKQVGKLNFKICRSLLDDIITVDEGAVCSTILQLYNDDGLVVEPAGAIGVSALEKYKNQIKGKRVGVIICGGNNDVARTEEIRERALLWEGKKHYFIVRFPQRAGALREFLNVLGPRDDIAHFEYTKKNNRTTGPAIVGIELKLKEDFNALIKKMDEKGIDYEHINDRPLLYELIV